MRNNHGKLSNKQTIFLTPILARNRTHEREAYIENHCDLNSPNNWKIKLAFFIKLDVDLGLESGNCLLTTQLILHKQCNGTSSSLFELWQC